MYTSGNFAKKIGINIRTLGKWAKNGKLLPELITETNRKMYSHEQYVKYMKEKFNIEAK